VEVGIRRATLNILNAQLNLSMGEILIVLEVSQIALQHSALDDLRSDLATTSFVDTGSSNVTLVKHAGSTKAEPFLLGERVSCLLA
jgi:hypothetical protein